MKVLIRIAVLFVLLALIGILGALYLDPEKRILDESGRAGTEGRYISLPDGVTHYDVAGPKNAPTVVFIHGLSAPYFIWGPTARELVNAGFQVLRYDLYGRGYSDRPNVTYNLDLYRRQLKNLLSATKIGTPVDLVGISIGAEIAADFANHFPQNVNKLCFISPMGFPLRLPDSVKILYIPVLGEYVFTVAGPKLISFIEKDVLSGLSPEDLATYRKQMEFKGFRHAIISTIRNVPLNNTMSLYEQIGKNRTPVLLIWGTKDTFPPYRNSDIARNLMPNARFLPVYQAGHASHLEQPETVNHGMIKFLQ